MRLLHAATPIFALVLASAAPALARADSVAASSGPSGSVVVNSKPCRVVTTHDGEGSTASNSTSITAGPNGVTGSTTVSPGGGGGSSSITVGSGSSSTASGSSSAAGSDCVIYHHQK